MKKYVKSIITALICFVIVSVLNFLLPRLLPGDPIAYLTGMDENALSPEKYQYYYDALHLGDSLWVQFAVYLKSIFDGTLGYSYKQEAVVSALIFKSIGRTLQITIPAVVISTTAGLSWGLRSGLKKGSTEDKLSTGFNIVVNSVPGFVIGLVLIIVFCFDVRLFPYTGLNSAGVAKGSLRYVLDRLWHLTLPILTLVIAELPSRYILMRNTAAKIADEKYVLYARQRGLSGRVIRYKYMLPNIAESFITMVGLSVSSCIGGSLVIENLYSVKGMGSLLMTAVHSLDYPLMQGILFVTTFIMVISIILTDLLCMLLNPRIRLKEEGGRHE